MRFPLCLLQCLLVATLLLSPTHAQEARRATLSIPNLLPALEGGAVGDIPHTGAQEIRIALNRPRSGIAPGSVTVRLNSRSVPSDIRDDPQTGGAIVVVRLSDSAVPLSPAINTVEVEFEERYRGPRYEYFVLHVRATGAGGGRSTPPTNPSARRHALVVGVSAYKYQGDGLANLPFAARDAADIHGVLTSPAAGAIAPTRACLLTDENATLENVRRAIARLGATTQPDDIVVIFFAGQVLGDPKRPESPFVVLHDSKPGTFASTAMPLSEIETLYATTLKDRRVVTFLDAGRRQGGVATAGNGQLGNELWLGAATSAGGVGFAAAGPSQISKESAQFGGGHGLFAFALAGGLRGEADADRDGTVIVDELAAFLDRRYREAADEGSRLPVAPRVASGSSGTLALAGRAVSPGRGQAVPGEPQACETR